MGVVYDLRGPIRVGDRFVWEPGNTKAWSVVRVTDVKDNGEEVSIQTTSERGGVWGRKTTLYWNDESRFREACVPLAAWEDGSWPSLARQVTSEDEEQTDTFLADELARYAPPDVALRLTLTGPGSRPSMVEYVRTVIGQRTTVNDDTTADRLAQGIVTSILHRLGAGLSIATGEATIALVPAEQPEQPGDQAVGQHRRDTG